MNQVNLYTEFLKTSVILSSTITIAVYSFDKSVDYYLLAKHSETRMDAASNMAKSVAFMTGKYASHIIGAYSLAQTMIIASSELTKLLDK